MHRRSLYECRQDVMPSTWPLEPYLHENRAAVPGVRLESKGLKCNMLRKIRNECGVVLRSGREVADPFLESVESAKFHIQRFLGWPPLSSRYRLVRGTFTQSAKKHVVNTCWNCRSTLASRPSRERITDSSPPCLPHSRTKHTKASF